MSQSQQEAYQVICKGTPQKLLSIVSLIIHAKKSG